MRPPVKIRVPSPGRRALPAVGLAAVGLFLVARTPSALVSSLGRLKDAPRVMRDDAEAALARFRGPEYAAAIARIRETLPENAEYLLLESPAQTFVRFDLAPRRAVFGGNPKDLAVNVTPATLPSLPKWTVIPTLDAPGPRLVRDAPSRRKGALP